MLGFLGFTNWITPLLIAGAILAVLGFAYFKGYQAASLRAELIQERINRQALETQLTLWKKTSERDQKQAEEDAKLLDDYDEQIRKLQDELQDPDRPCLDASDTERLRDNSKR